MQTKRLENVHAPKERHLTHPNKQSHDYICSCSTDWDSPLSPFWLRFMPVQARTLVNLLISNSQPETS